MTLMYPSLSHSENIINNLNSVLNLQTIWSLWNSWRFHTPYNLFLQCYMFVYTFGSDLLIIDNTFELQIWTFYENQFISRFRDESIRLFVFVKYCLFVRKRQFVAQLPMNYKRDWFNMRKHADLTISSNLSNNKCHMDCQN